MPSIWSNLRRKDGLRTRPLPLVVGLNRVDEIVYKGWDAHLNLPTPEAELEIDRRCNDLVRLLAASTGIDREHIEYYSAAKRYRLYQLLNRIIQYSVSGFRFSDVEPLPFEELEGVTPEAQQIVKDERLRLLEQSEDTSTFGGSGELLPELGRFVSEEDLRSIKEKFDAQVSKPPRIAVLGQSGVGKTTTVNALFATDWRTSPVEVGTHYAQSKTVSLASGGQITVNDLPGYGRSRREDADYEKIYREIIPACDLILLIIQADRGDLADDQEMIIRLKNWINETAVQQNS